MCSCLIILYCSLGFNRLTDTGAIALARLLQHNKSLEEMKWVIIYSLVLPNTSVSHIWWNQVSTARDKCQCRKPGNKASNVHSSVTCSFYHLIALIFTPFNSTKTHVSHTTTQEAVPCDRWDEAVIWSYLTYMAHTKVYPTSLLDLANK